MELYTIVNNIYKYMEHLIVANIKDAILKWVYDEFHWKLRIYYTELDTDYDVELMNFYNYYFEKYKKRKI